MRIISPLRRTVYCYVPPHIEVHAPKHPDQTGWTVVCLAKHPKRKGVHIVGWYKDATLLGRWREVIVGSISSSRRDGPNAMSK